jgi:hypothetical protein
MFKWTSIAGMVAAASLLGMLSLPKPAGAQTLNTVLSTAASIGQQILFGNFQQTQQPANTVVGYTQNGGTLYGNGRLVMPNGQTFWPDANGRYSFGQYAYFSPRANPQSFTIDSKRTGQFDRTHRHGKGHAYAYGHNTPPGWNPHRAANSESKNKHVNNGQGNNGQGNAKHGDGDDKHEGGKH